MKQGKITSRFRWSPPSNLVGQLQGKRSDYPITEVGSLSALSGQRMSLTCYSRSDRAGIEFFERKFPVGRPKGRTVAARKTARSLARMRDIVIGIAFLAMLLSPALVASFSKRKSDDEA